VIQLQCQTCHVVTVLDATEHQRIREELSRLGPAARRIWECPACNRYQVVFAVKSERRLAA
jgi:hypothetical protein